MSFGAIIKVVFTFLPEFISLVKSISIGLKNGVDALTVRHRLKAIEKAFGHSDRRRAARELNDVFKK